MARYIGTVETLTTTFTVNGTPTDPSTLTLTVTAPDGTVTTKTIDQVTHVDDGVYSYDVALAQAGVWSWRWVGTGTAAGADEGSFYVDASFPGGRLCSLDDVKAARIGLPTALDTLLEPLIARASAALTEYAGREFLRTAVAGDRTFPLTRSGWVPIDDLAAAPTAAKTYDAFGTLVQTLTVSTDLVLYPRNRPSGAPITAVGIVRGCAGVDLKLTGVWGWPAVPENVREAAIVTVVEWLKDAQGFTPQSPADPFEPGSPPSRGLPLKARDLVKPYRRLGVA